MIKSLNKGLQGNCVDAPKLGAYCAMMLTNPFIVEMMMKTPEFDRGFGIYNSIVVSTLEDILEYLSMFLLSDKNYVITEDDLNYVGKLILRIKSNL